MEDQKRSRVVLAPCPDYEEEKVYRALREGLGLLGGIGAFAGPGERVLIKPNLVRRADVSRAVTTHPAVLAAVARLLREAGVTDVAAGDSCGIGTAADAAAGAGIQKALEPYGVPVIEFTGAGKIPFDGVQAGSFYLSREVLEADALINVCKMKTHALERVTGAVKNLYGCVHGLHKAKGHTQYPSADSFARMLVDLNRLVKPRLHIMDGIVAMEGNGPTSGDPVSMGVLLISEDPVALDSVFCRLIHLDPRMVPTNYHGEKMGLGFWQEENICLLTPGQDGPEELSMDEAVRRYGREAFRVDRRKARTGLWVRLARVFNLFQKRPYVDKNLCVKCGICVESCPVEGKALHFADGRKEPPVYDYKKCIRCFCCQEMCPHKAIKVK